MRRHNSGQRLGRGPLLAGLSLTETRDDESLLDRHPCFEARHRFSGIEEHDHYEDTTYTIDLRTDSTQAETGYGGQFNSRGGSQFMGNSFNTGGGPIYLDSSSGAF